MSTSSTQTALKNRYFASLATQHKQDVFIATSLFILGLLTRLPFTGEILYHWDAVNFAKALERFDVWAGQPHVPGYILYVGLTKIFNLVFKDAQTTLVVVSIASSALSIVFLYFLGRDIFNRSIGLMGALFLAASPLFWFYGEIALPHTLDTLAVIVLVWLLYRIFRGEHHLVILTAIFLGIAGGLRPQTQVFLLPLVVYVGWRVGWRRAIQGGIALAIVNFSWFIPLIWLTGGIERYFYIMGKYSANFNENTSVFSAGLLGLSRNMRKLTMYTLYAWSLFAIPALLAGVLLAWEHLIKPGERGLWDRLRITARRLLRPRFWFFAIWIVPAFAYYGLIHMGQQGLVFIFLPALMLFSAVAVEYLLSTRFLSRFSIRQPVSQLLVLSLIFFSSAIFLAAPTYPLGVDRFKLLTFDTIQQHDKFYQARFEGVRQSFSPAHTLLLAYEWVFPDYYLRLYEHEQYEIGARWDVGDGQPTIRQAVALDVAVRGLRPDSDGYLYMVILDDVLLEFNHSDARLESIMLSDGNQLYYVRFRPEEWLYIGPESYGLVPQHMMLPLEEFYGYDQD